MVGGGAIGEDVEVEARREVADVDPPVGAVGVQIGLLLEGLGREDGEREEEEEEGGGCGGGRRRRGWWHGGEVVGKREEREGEEDKNSGLPFHSSTWVIVFLSGLHK